MGVADHDHGATMDAYIVTRRLGYGDTLRKKLRNVSVCAENTANDVAVTTTLNGRATQFSTAKVMSLTAANETRLGVEGWTLSGVGTRLMSAMQRIRQTGLNKMCDFVQLKIASGGRGKPLKLNYVEAEFKGYPGRQRGSRGA